MTRMLGLRAVLGWIGITFVTAFGLSLFVPHDSYIRYQAFQDTIYARLGWIYERIHFDPTPIDVLLIGSSRVARGANAAQIEAQLATLGHDIRVENFSVPATGLDLRLSLLRETLREKDVKLILFGVQEVLPRKGHDAFGWLGRAGEILTSPPVPNLTLPANIAGLPYRQFDLALASAVPEAFGYRAEFDPASYAGAAADHRYFANPAWTPALNRDRVLSAGHAEVVAQQSRMRHRVTRPAILPASLGGVEFGVSRSYLARLKRLADAEGAELVFLFLPFYEGLSEPTDAAYLQSIAPIWSASFMMRDPTLYVDSAHASVFGVPQISEWLARRLDLQPGF